MANPEHLAILKLGVAVWNTWRQEHPERPDLSFANLNGRLLNKANFNDADLSRASLANADLRDANLKGAQLRGVNLTNTLLQNADFRNADLNFAILRGADPTQADFSEALVGWTAFVDIDLSVTKGLETVHHHGPSNIGIDTIYKSGGKVAEVFLRGAGVPDNFITYISSLVGKPIEFYSCFISYSSKDQIFADRLYADLQAAGVRCWFAPEDLKIGDRFRDSIDESIRLHDKLLLILSNNSVPSPWVATEVEAAFEREHRQPNHVVLFPIRLDDAVMNTNQAWAADIRRTRQIGDFSGWKDHDFYTKAFSRLLRDLKAEPPKA